MAVYTVRTEQVDGGWVAHIDQDGLVCIMQPNLPGLQGNFASQADAKAWADGHAADLTAQNEASIAAAALAAERAATQHAANLAAIDTAEALKALVAHLAR
jgi:hypothetical protein